jgi:hypothetical protein
MAGKHAGQGAAILVLAAITGLTVLIGVILLMMWFQPGIQHHPSKRTDIAQRRLACATGPSSLSLPMSQYDRGAL